MTRIKRKRGTAFDQVRILPLRLAISVSIARDSFLRSVSLARLARSLARSLWHSLKQVALRLVKVRYIALDLALLLGGPGRPFPPLPASGLSLPLVTAPTSRFPRSAAAPRRRSRLQHWF